LQDGGYYPALITQQFTNITKTVVAHTAVAKIEKISLWNFDFGSERIIEQNEEYTKLANNLISILEKANLQAKCAIFKKTLKG